MIQIKPIQLGLPSKTATHLFVRPIINSTTDTSCNTYFEIISKENIEIEGVFVDMKLEILQSGNHPISESDYALWADDNSYIEDLVLTYLGLERL